MEINVLILINLGFNLNNCVVGNSFNIDYYISFGGQSGSPINCVSLPYCSKQALVDVKIWVIIYMITISKFNGRSYVFKRGSFYSSRE